MHGCLIFLMIYLRFVAAYWVPFHNKSRIIFPPTLAQNQTVALRVSADTHASNECLNTEKHPANLRGRHRAPPYKTAEEDQTDRLLVLDDDTHASTECLNSTKHPANLVRRHRAPPYKIAEKNQTDNFISGLNDTHGSTECWNSEKRPGNLVRRHRAPPYNIAEALRSDCYERENSSDESGFAPEIQKITESNLANASGNKDDPGNKDLHSSKHETG